MSITIPIVSASGAKSTVSIIDPVVTGATPQTLFINQAPAQVNISDGVNYELGTKLQFAAPGNITAIRFWKASNETGAHTGKVYSATGTLLASVTYPIGAASGWQRAPLTTPLPVLANTTYVTTTNTSAFWYVATNNGLTSQIVNGDVKSVVGGNGVFGPVGAMPTNTFQASNYFRDVEFVRTGAADTIAPSTPTGLTALPASSSQVNLAWHGSTDNVGVTGYNIYRNGTAVGTAPSNSYTDNGLAASTAYTYSVSAFDAAGNTSGQTTGVILTTQAPSSGGYDNLANWPSITNRPAFNSGTATLTWTGPAAGGVSTSSDVQQTLSLTNSGSVTTSANNQVIQGLNISGNLTVNHTGVLITRCRISGGIVNIFGASGASSGTVIEDCDLNCSIDGPPQGIVKGVTVRRCASHDVENNITKYLNNLVVEDSIFYNAAGADCDQIECYTNGSSNNITVRHNTFTGPELSGVYNSGINLSNFGSPINGSIGPNVTIQNNRFVNCGRFFAICDDNAFGSGTIRANVTNNGFFGPSAFRRGNSSIGATLLLNSGNYVMANQNDTSGTPTNGTGAI